MRFAIVWANDVSESAGHETPRRLLGTSKRGYGPLSIGSRFPRPAGAVTAFEMQRVDSDKLKHYLRDDVYAQGVDDLLAAGSDEGGISGVLFDECRPYTPSFGALDSDASCGLPLIYMYSVWMIPLTNEGFRIRIERQCCI